MDIEVDRADFEDTFRKLKVFLNSPVDDYYDVWVEATKDIHAHVERKFAVQGPGWKEIEDRWRRYKESRGFHTEILRMTGQMEQSLLSPFGLHPGSVWNPTPNHLEYGTDVRSERGKPYPAYHNTPGSQREFLDPEEIAGAAAQGVERWALRKMEDVFDG